MRNRIVVLLMIVLTLLNACIGEGHETKSSEESTGIVQTSVQTASSVEETVTPVEETVPFDVAEDAKIYYYDRDNLLGLNAVIVNGSSEVIYVFDLRKDLVEYSKGEGFRVYGNDSKGESFVINEYLFEKDDCWQYVLLKCDEKHEIDGFYLIKRDTSIQYEVKKNDLPEVIVYENKVSSETSNRIVMTSRQSYNAEKQSWNETEENTEEVTYELIVGIVAFNIRDCDRKIIN